MTPQLYKKGAPITVGTLARFAAGLDWPSIVALTNGRLTSWWRWSVLDAEDRGLLRWHPRTKVWHLTDAGRAAVRGVS